MRWKMQRVFWFEEAKKMMRKKMKSKGVSHSPPQSPVLLFFCWLFVFLLGWGWLGKVKVRKRWNWRRIRMIIRITRFEEFYVEPPMRPKETEEKKLLDDLTSVVMYLPGGPHSNLCQSRGKSAKVPCSPSFQHRQGTYFNHYQFFCGILHCRSLPSLPLLSLFEGVDSVGSKTVSGSWSEDGGWGRGACCWECESCCWARFEGYDGWCWVSDPWIFELLFPS